MATETVTLYVGPELVDCTGVGPMKCMLVRRSPDEPYQYFYNPIVGFEFEAGYEYELEVAVTEVANPPADGSSLRYTLVRVVNKEAVTSMEFSLEGTRWNLTSLRTEEGEMVAALPRPEAYAKFEDGRVSGSGSCNRFGAGYTVDGNALSVSAQMMSTMMACQPPIMKQEQLFLANLRSAASYSLDGDTLSITNSDGDVVLTMTADVAVGLVGTHWVARNYNNGRGGVQTLISGTEITIEFRDDGGLSGSAGCNRYKAVYTLDGDSLSIGPAMTTRKMCATPDGLMEQEARYLESLGAVATYHIESKVLELRTESGSLVASFNAGGSAEG